MNDELRKMWLDAVLIYLKVLLQHISVDTEERHDKS